MKKIISTLLASITISSYAFDNSADRIFDATKRERSSSNIIWKIAKNIQKECAAELKKHGAKPIAYTVNACAVWFGPENNTCIIITERKFTMHTLGHEVLHCFLGHWH
jgi:hypothetical protein